MSKLHEGLRTAHLDLLYHLRDTPNSSWRVVETTEPRRVGSTFMVPIPGARIRLREIMELGYVTVRTSSYSGQAV